MRLVIVGHGARLRRKRLGPVIDGFDWVCKVKRGVSREKAHLETPELAGARCDAVAGPLRPNLKGIDVRGCSEFWAVRLKKHRRGDHRRWWLDWEELSSNAQIPIRSDYAALTKWGERYKRLAPMCGPSSGLEAIIVGLELYRPELLALAGFDQMETGQTSEWATKLGKDPHPARIEREILAQLKEFYCADIEIL